MQMEMCKFVVVISQCDMVICLIRYGPLVDTHGICKRAGKKVIISAGYPGKYVSECLFFLCVQITYRSDMSAVRENLNDE